MQVVVAPGASVVTGQVISGAVPVPLNAVSLICSAVTVTLPVLPTRNEYVTVWPAADIVVGETVLSSVSVDVGGSGEFTHAALSVVLPFSWPTGNSARL